jgi:ribonucleotide reductase beta subunit family protein with ferritin-like domain
MEDLFSGRVNIKPYDYPDLLEYKDAIRHSYWIHTEFNYDDDVQDFKINCTEVERSIIKKTMLAIAQIEVSVKTFWAKLYDRFPVPEIGSVGMTFAECHEEGTEILTVNGWTDFRDVTNETMVAQVEPETSKITFSTPDRIVNKTYEGKLHYVENQTYSFAVTPGHRMIYKTRAGNIKEKEIQNVGSFHSDMNLPFTAVLDAEGRTELSSQERFKIAVQADGSARYYRNSEGERIRRGLSKSYHTYEVTLKRGRKKTRFADLLEELDLEYRQFNDNRDGYVKYEIDVPLDWGDLKTFDWVDLSDKTAEWCQDFIDELIKWDGTSLKDKGNNVAAFGRYTSTVKSCVDKAQAIGTYAGYRATIYAQEDDRKESYKTCYNVTFSTRNRYSSVTTGNETKDYSGNVYCVSVPTGCIITRHNDKVLISGNSEVRHMDAYSHLLEILGLNSEFEKIEQVPAMMERIEYLDKYIGDARNDSDEEYVLSVILFSIFIEHVSLFSQFLIMTAFDKYEKRFLGIANAVEATSKEEQIHGLFGIELVDKIREERPELFTERFENQIKEACWKAYEAEMEILDWIFDEGELDFLPRAHVEEFVKDKFNRSLENVQLDPIFETDQSLLDETVWFYEDIIMTKDNDFFSKRGTAYNKNSKSVTSDDLF